MTYEVKYRIYFSDPHEKSSGFIEKTYSNGTAQSLEELIKILENKGRMFCRKNEFEYQKIGISVNSKDDQ